MRRVIWSPQARRDLLHIREYIRPFNTPAAERMGQRLSDLGNSLVTASERGREIRPGIRQIAAIRPYLLRYRVTDDAVTIIRIIHSARQQD
jgi:toxin ParE1/3/4